VARVDPLIPSPGPVRVDRPGLARSGPSIRSSGIPGRAASMTAVVQDEKALVTGIVCVCRCGSSSRGGRLGGTGEGQGPGQRTKEPAIGRDGTREQEDGKCLKAFHRILRVSSCGPGKGGELEHSDVRVAAPSHY
jgi:hypothetical protein